MEDKFYARVKVDSTLEFDETEHTMWICLGKLE